MPLHFDMPLALRKDITLSGLNANDIYNFSRIRSNKKVVKKNMIRHFDDVHLKSPSKAPNPKPDQPKILKLP